MNTVYPQSASIRGSFVRDILCILSYIMVFFYLGVETERHIWCVAPGEESKVTSGPIKHSSKGFDVPIFFKDCAIQWLMWYFVAFYFLFYVWGVEPDSLGGLIHHSGSDTYL